MKRSINTVCLLLYFIMNLACCSASQTSRIADSKQKSINKLSHLPNKEAGNRSKECNHPNQLDMQGRGKKAKLTFLFSPKSLDNRFFANAILGAEYMATVLSNNNYEVIVKTVGVPGTGDSVTGGKQQRQLIETEMANGKVDGLVISPSGNSSDKSAGITADWIDHLGIPVVAFDNTVEGATNLVTFYAMDNEAVAHQAGEIMAKLLNHSGTVGIMTSGNEGNIGKRVKGFREKMATFPGITVIEEMVDCEIADYSPYKCAHALDAFVEKYGADLDGMYFAAKWMHVIARDYKDKDGNKVYGGTPPRGTPASVPVYRKWAPGKINVAIDAMGKTFEFVGDEKVPFQALLAQPVWGYGADSMQMLFDHVTKGKNFDSFVDSGAYILCEDNIELFKAMWDTYNFDAELTECNW